MSNQPPRVALYLRSLMNTGIEPVMLTLAEQLSQKGLGVDFILNHVNENTNNRIPANVNIIDLKEPKLLRGLSPLVSYIQKIKPLALLSAQHLTNETALIAKIFSRTSTKFIVTEHNTVSVEWRDKKKITELLTPFFVRILYPLADGRVAVSKGVAEDLARVTHLSQKTIQVIYNPVITEKLKQKSKEALEHPWFKQGEPPVILGVGRLTAQKDFPTLIRAFAKIKQIKPARLMILGNGPERLKLNALIKELSLEGTVSMEGHVENPFAYMKQAKVFVLSSAWEGLPTVLIEAMAVGTPVISTNCKSGPAEILDGGKYGDLVPVGDVKSMADAILKVLLGNIKTVDSTWLKQFTLDTAIEQYIKILGIS